MTRRSVLVALSALLVVDAIVVGVALQRTRAFDVARTTPALTTPTPVAEEPAREPGAATDDAEPTPEVAPAARLTRWLDAASPDAVWRATAGSCPEEVGTIERSTDGGATWTPLGAPAALLRLNAEDETSAFVVGRASPDCATSFWSTGDGETWTESPQNTSAAWHLLDKGGVATPGGALRTPCPQPVDLAPVSGTAAGLLCSDGAVLTTADGGTSWTPSGQVAGGLAIGRVGEEYLVAAVRPECDGVYCRGT